MNYNTSDLFNQLMVEKEQRENSRNIKNAMTYAKYISDKVNDYVKDNFSTNKQVIELKKLFKEIFSNSYLQEMREISSYLDLPQISELKKDDYKIIQLPAINTEKRRKMINAKTDAYTINFKRDLQNYIDEFKICITEFVDIIFYGDDITVSQPLGPFRHNNAYFHMAYRISNATNLYSSKLVHFRTYGVVASKYAKFDQYQTLIKNAIEDINTTEIEIGLKKVKARVVLVIGDNQFMHYLLKVPLNFSNKGINNCRCCTVSGKKWKDFRTTQSLIKFIRKKHAIDYLPPLNHLNMDGFHDIMSGSVNYFLSGCVNIFLKLVKDDFTEQDLINEIIKNATNLDREGEIRTLLKPGFFKTGKKLSDKKKSNMSGAECILITRCFWKILCSTQLKDYNVIIKSKLKEMEILIKSSLNLSYAINDYTLKIEECATIFDENSEIIFKMMFKLFGETFGVTTKIHNLLHYGYAIRNLNMLPYMFNTIRFESSNQRIKTHLRNSNCRINAPKSIIKKIIFCNSINKNTNENTYENSIHRNIRNQSLKWNYNIENHNETLNTSDDLEVEKDLLNASAYLSKYAEDAEKLSESDKDSSYENVLDNTYRPGMRII